MNTSSAPLTESVTRVGWICGAAPREGAADHLRKAVAILRDNHRATDEPDSSPHPAGLWRVGPRAAAAFRFNFLSMSGSTEPPAGARADATRGVFPSAPHRYRAFISYSHTDTRWASWLMKKLEGYRVPARFHGRPAPVGEVGPRLAPVFRDRDELPTTSDLGETIRTALRESATLIVICSPHSAKSRWVGEEIKAFKRLHGERRVYAFIVDGEPKHEGAADDCFSPALRRELGADGECSGAPAEAVAADARPQGDGPRLAFVRLVAGLLGVGFDELRQRELQRRNRRLTLVTSASVFGMAITLGLAIAAWRARNEAVSARNEAVVARNDAERRQEQAEGVLSFMLGGFRTDLKKVGQLGLLDRVGDKAMDYFARAEVRDLTDSALALEAKALTQIGEIRLDQKDVRFAEAERAFRAAYEHAARLAARHPENGDMLFERAQAEFWIGAVRRRAGDFAGAVEWLVRYRDSAVALTALDPANLKWRTELIFGQHNLAVLDADRGALPAARAGFFAESESVRAMAALEPKNAKWPYRMMDIHSYLGATAERMGELAEARREFAEQISLIEKLIADDPQNGDLQFKLADALTWQVDAMLASGQRDTARSAAERGESTMRSLLRRDASNRRWQAILLNHRTRLAQIDAAVESTIGDTVDSLEQLLAAEPADGMMLLRTTLALRLKLCRQIQNSSGEISSSAARSVQIASLLSAGASITDRARGEAAAAFVVAGRASAALGQSEAARTLWQRAADLLAPRLAGCRDWRLLDPAARALALLGHASESRDLITRLEQIGYVPLDPFSVSSSSPTK